MWVYSLRSINRQAEDDKFIRRIIDTKGNKHNEPTSSLMSSPLSFFCLATHTHTIPIHTIPVDIFSCSLYSGLVLNCFNSRPNTRCAPVCVCVLVNTREIQFPDLFARSPSRACVEKSSFFLIFFFEKYIPRRKLISRGRVHHPSSYHCLLIF